MKRFALFTLILGCLAISAQSPATPPGLLVADVHASPRRSYPFFFAVLLPQNRYVVRDATMLDLVATAWNLNPENVQGGPAWLEHDHYDIIANLPSNASKADQRLMLQDLLKTRFHLALHNGTVPLPAFILTSDKAKSRLRPAAETSASECREADQGPTAPGAIRVVHVACRNMSMEQFATQIHDMAGGYLTKPVVDSTQLGGSWDFDLKWTSRGDLAKAGPDGISIFDAVDKQLGLKLSLETAPRPVVLVDSVLRQPTANAPDLDRILPPPALPQFEVATIKPSKPGTEGNGRISGEEVNFKAILLKDLIDLAWDLSENDHENIVNAPKWLSEDRFDLSAKVSPQSAGIAAAGGANLPMDIYEVQEMLRALLIERFQIKAHMEVRPIEAYTLYAAKPRLRPADPTVRTVCKEGPGPDGKDPRLANPELNRLVSCRNMTMPEICDELNQQAGGYIFSPVLDATDLKGSYDFTLSFSSADRLAHAAPHPATASGESISDPNGALSVFDAVNRQLGLKLVKQRRPNPVLVIDHIEEKPTAN